MHSVSGGCHCGNILVDLNLSAPPQTLHPRACDCDFCRKHGAAYVSDRNGELIVRIGEPRERSTYTQGSGQAEFLLCRRCGVLVGAFYRSKRQIHASVNVRALQGVAFAAEQSASPQQLSEMEKVRRWHEIWFANVEILESRE